MFGEVTSTPHLCNSKFQSERWDNWNLVFQLTLYATILILSKVVSHYMDSPANFSIFSTLFALRAAPSLMVLGRVFAKWLSRKNCYLEQSHKHYISYNINSKDFEITYYSSDGIYPPELLHSYKISR